MTESIRIITLKTSVQKLKPYILRLQIAINFNVYITINYKIKIQILKDHN